jgi:endonuclease/exonuclease/phosphatase family metal-dependent hydrolase
LTTHHDPTRGDHTGTLRLYTHNIWAFGGEWSDRRRVLIDGIAELAPDVVLLQETMLTDAYDQARDILGAEYTIVHAQTREANGSGISIGSRWPILAVEELDLKGVSPRTGDFACTTFLAEIEAPAPFGRLLLVNHFPDYHTNHEIERERQTVIAARAIDEIVAHRSAHVLLGGDLDAEPDAASLRFLAGKQSLGEMSVCYQNAWDAVHPGEPGHTFTPVSPLVPPAWPFKRIDHIFLRCGEDDQPTLAIVACDVVFAEPRNGVWASDHFGLVADFTVQTSLSDR